MEGPYYFKNLTVKEEKSFFLQIESEYGILVASLLVISLMWGSYMKYLTYSFLNQVKIFEKPINLMILVSQTVHHVLYLFLGPKL